MLQFNDEQAMKLKVNLQYQDKSLHTGKNGKERKVINEEEYDFTYRPRINSRKRSRKS